MRSMKPHGPSSTPVPGSHARTKPNTSPNLLTRNRPSEARMATASGQELKSRGTFKIQAKTSEGQDVSPDFEDTDVDMPIIAVNDISHDDMEVIFRQDNGELIDGSTGRSSR